MKAASYRPRIYLSAAKHFSTSSVLLDAARLAPLGEVIHSRDPAYADYTFEQFVALAASCDVVAFRAFPDGKIGSGTAQELAAARKVGP